VYQLLTRKAWRASSPFRSRPGAYPAPFPTALLPPLFHREWYMLPFLSLPTSDPPFPPQRKERARCSEASFRTKNLRRSPLLMPPPSGLRKVRPLTDLNPLFGSCEVLFLEQFPPLPSPVGESLMTSFLHFVRVFPIMVSPRPPSFLPLSKCPFFSLRKGVCTWAEKALRIGRV